MSAVPTNLPPWAEIVSVATVRAAENRLAAVSVDAESLRLLWNAWHDEKERATNHAADLSRARAECVEVRNTLAETKSELENIRRRVAHVCAALD